MITISHIPQNREGGEMSSRPFDSAQGTILRLTSAPLGNRRSGNGRSLSKFETPLRIENDVIAREWNDRNNLLECNEIAASLRSPNGFKHSQ